MALKDASTEIRISFRQPIVEIWVDVEVRHFCSTSSPVRGIRGKVTERAFDELRADIMW